MLLLKKRKRKKKGRERERTTKLYMLNESTPQVHTLKECPIEQSIICKSTDDIKITASALEAFSNKPLIMQALVQGIPQFLHSLNTTGSKQRP